LGGMVNQTSQDHPKHILWVDDEPLQIQSAYEYLEDCGYSVAVATSEATCLAELAGRTPDVVIVDVMIPSDGSLPSEKTKGGRETGIALAREVQRRCPSALIVGCSVSSAPDVVQWFRSFVNGYISKADIYNLKSFKRRIDLLIDTGTIPARVFIVHGRAEKEKLELKNYLQNTLRLPEPVILHDRPNLGRTLIEKFEQEAVDVDLVFVLMTPDDIASPVDETNEGRRRSRQNVIFEMGFFFGKLQRTSGRIVLLYRGDLELPSDVAGIVYIDIAAGIEAAGESIRRELEGVL
jgi:predicted nucleotide-binding protein